MMRAIEPGQWRVARAPEQAGDDWSVIFRMDDRAPGEKGPQIVLTGSPLSDYNEEAGWEVPYGASITFKYQIWDSNKGIGKSASHSYSIDYDAPIDYDGEPETLDLVIEMAYAVIEDYGAHPHFIDWDGSAEALRP